MEKTSKSKKNSFPFWFIFTILLYFIGFSIAFIGDLTINQAIYSPTNIFAVFMEAFGWYPAFLVFSFYCAMWFSKPSSKQKKGMRFLSIFLFVVTFAIMCWQSLHYLLKRDWIHSYTDWRSIFWILLVALFALIIFSFAYQSPLSSRTKLLFFGFWGTIYLAANQAAIYLIKTLWQRTRFDDMVAMGNFSDFTAWYHPFGNGGSSFPSGHTANAAGFFVLIILCDLFFSWNKKRKWVYSFIWIYIALMALSRVLIGRHFLSDTLAASGIMAILFFILRRTSFYKNGIKKYSENK